MQINLEQVVAVRTANETVVEHRLFAARHLLAVGISLVLLFVACEPVCEGARWLCRGGAYNGVVRLADFASHAKHFVESCQGLAGACKHYHTADGTVETVYNTQKNLAGLVVLVLDVSLHLVDQCAVARFVTLHNLAGSLVDDDDVVVFV